MPQLAKGGKHVFGWSNIGKNGRILIPPEAFDEYGFRGVDKLILMSASKRSGGFVMTTVKKLASSQIDSLVTNNPELSLYNILEGEVIKSGQRMLCWVNLNHDGSFVVPINTLQLYGAEPKGKLLVVRGSGLALGFLVRGPIIEEAKKHPELEVFV